MDNSGKLWYDTTLQRQSILPAKSFTRMLRCCARRRAEAFRLHKSFSLPVREYLKFKKLEEKQ